MMFPDNVMVMLHMMTLLTTLSHLWVLDALVPTHPPGKTSGALGTDPLSPGYHILATDQHYSPVRPNSHTLEQDV